MKTREELIAHYEDMLEKVKAAYRVDDSNRAYVYEDRCKAYVKQAEDDLEAVKNGREW